MSGFNIRTELSIGRFEISDVVADLAAELNATPVVWKPEWRRLEISYDAIDTLPLAAGSAIAIDSPTLGLMVVIGGGEKYDNVVIFRNKCWDSIQIDADCWGNKPKQEKTLRELTGFSEFEKLTERALLDKGIGRKAIVQKLAKIAATLKATA